MGEKINKYESSIRFIANKYYTSYNAKFCERPLLKVSIQVDKNKQVLNLLKM